jgi:hypothetical protein
MAGIVGLAAHLLTGVLYVGSPLVAPPPGVLVLAAGWLLLLVVAIRLRRERPWFTLLVPAVSIAFWVAVLSLGELLFGWTA